MNFLPPKIVRRLVLAPLVFIVCASLVIASPALLVVALIADLFLPGNWRTLRITAFILLYALMEIIGLAALVVLWIASGFGLRMKSPSMRTAHFGLMRWWLRQINSAAIILFNIKIQIEDKPTPRKGPVLVFSRHAGPGNSMLLVGTILIGFKRRPRIVMLAKLQWEPLYDIFLNRLPNRFIQHDPSRREIYVNAIGELANGLGDADAFVLFPEGKDFTPEVKKRAIEYLKGKGHRRSAERAEKMEHVLPPRHNGVMAALRSAPNADVVFVAHAVLEELGTFKQLWSRIPMTYPIVARYWRIAPSDVPQGKDELIEWLFTWWETIDQWIDEREKAIAAGKVELTQPLLPGRDMFADLMPGEID